MAYKLLDQVTPLKKDCGILCNKKCCAEWEKGVGMYLLPGEEQMFSQDETWLDWEAHSCDDYRFAPSWTGVVYFVKCNTACPRDKRPFACRTFPLAPYLTDKGVLQIVFDHHSLHVCPLSQEGDKTLLDRRFLKRVREAWILLLEDPIIYDGVFWESRECDEEKNNSYQKLFVRKKKKINRRRFK